MVLVLVLVPMLVLVLVLVQRTSWRSMMHCLVLYFRLHLHLHFASWYSNPTFASTTIASLH